MSKLLGIGINQSEIRAYAIRLMCTYLMNGEKVKKEAIIDIQTTSRELAVELAINKAKKQLELFPFIKNVDIQPLGKQRGKK